MAELLTSKHSDYHDVKYRNTPAERIGKGIGFAAQTRTDDKEYSRSVITKALNKSFAPEFINRLDEIITFDQLDINALEKIIDIELKGLLRTYGIFRL